MKAMNGLQVALGIAIAAAAMSVKAQDAASGNASAGAAISASAAPTDKATRQANRALRRKVYAALARHKEIDAGDIGVTANGGAVRISGTVQDASQINTVVAVAKGVTGVTSVTSKLSVLKPFGQ